MEKIYMIGFNANKKEVCKSEQVVTNSLDFLNGMRAIAALFVLISHFWYQIWPAATPPLGYSQRPTGLMLIFTSWLYYGHFAVVVFIVLSGFCLMLPVVQGNGRLPGGTIEFLKRRARRLLPPYYFSLLLSLLLIWLFIGSKTGSQWDITLPVTPFGVMANLLMLQDFIAVTQINYVFWSLAVFWQLYLCFPAFVLSWNRLGSLGTTIGVALVSYTIIRSLEITRIEDIPPQYIGLGFTFVLGMLGATIVFSKDRVYQVLHRRMPWQVFATILSLLIIFFCYLWGFDKIETNLAFIDTLCALATLSLILAASRPGTNRIRDFFSLRMLVIIGSFSYSLYLIHAPLIQLIWWYILHPLHLGQTSEFVWLILLGTPIILGLAYVFFLYCERPFLNQRRILKLR
jgi:peptidoglycan/LPS O-acetylase OafA/YrhL